MKRKVAVYFAQWFSSSLILLCCVMSSHAQCMTEQCKKYKALETKLNAISQNLPCGKLESTARSECMKKWSAETEPLYKEQRLIYGDDSAQEQMCQITSPDAQDCVITSETEVDRSPASSPKVSIEIIKALSKVKDGLGKMLQVKDVVEQMEKGKEVEVTDNQWEDLADDYASLAEELESTPLPTDFDAEGYKVSMDDFKKCSTRHQSLDKLEGFITELRAAAEQGESAFADLEEAEGEAKKSRTALNYLIGVHEKLVNVPIYGQVFQWDWFELETSVKRSLGKMESAIIKQKKKIKDNTKLIKQKVSNFDSNLKSIKDLPCQP